MVTLTSQTLHSLISWSDNMWACQKQGRVDATMASLSVLTNVILSCPSMCGYIPAPLQQVWTRWKRKDKNLRVKIVSIFSKI